MACGTPVVTSNVSSLPEVAGDAAICIDPRELDVLTDAIGELLTDARLRASLIERGYARAAAFTWDAAAEQLLAVYNRMMH